MFHNDFRRRALACFLLPRARLAAQTNAGESPAGPSERMKSPRHARPGED